MTKPVKNAPERRRLISIRWILSGAAVALTAMSVLGVGAFSERNARRTLTQELQTRLLLEARNLALTSSGALLTEFPELTLTPILSKMTEDEPELAYAVVVDLDGVIRGHADARRIGSEFELSPTLREVSAAPHRPHESVLADGELLVAASPAARRSGEEIGMSYVALRRDYVESMIRETRRKQLIPVAILLATGVTVALVLVSLLLRPVEVLREGLERIGRGDLDTPVRLRDRTELGLLAETMNEMSTKLKAARAEHVEKERLAREVELAREIQSSLLPSKELRAGRCLIDGAHRAAAEVGGDYWDVFPVSNGRLGVAIADVSGKGLAGCLVTSMLSALLRAFRNSESSPSALLARLERHLVESLRPGTFITMFYGILDPAKGTLVFASAGHSPLLVWRAAAGRAEWYKTKAIPIGAVRGGALAKTLHDTTIELATGDIALQYTDGINEAFDITGKEQFGFDRLQKIVAETAGSGCRAVIDRIQRDVKIWAGDQPPLDDETLLVMSVEGAPDPPAAGPAEPLAAVHAARAAGEGLKLRGHVDTLTGIAEWVAQTPGLRDLSPREVTILESALYEVAANIAEHGLGNNAAHTFELWMAPPPQARTNRRRTFVFVDDGAPFDPKRVARVDLRQAAARRRGRGIGLEIIHSVMTHVSYHAGTAAGNVTITEFDPESSRTEEEVTHG